MSQLFETSAAKKFGAVRRRGLRAVEYDEATRIPVDKLADIVVKLDSPQTLDELSRLVQPETFNRIAAKVFDDAYTKAYSGAKFDIEKFATALGIGKPTSGRYQTIKTMLEKSGANLSMKELDELVAAGRALTDMEIPDVSTFIARRATLAGMKGIVNGIVPGIALATGTGAAAYAGGPFLAAATFIGGGRLVSSILANPLSAQALKTVLRPEATRIVRRQAFVNAMRLGIEYMRDTSTDIPHFDFTKIYKAFGDFMRAYDLQIRDMEE